MANPPPENPPPAAPAAPVANKPDPVDEPKTLSPAELEAFRVEAGNVIEAHSPEVAAAIFLAGLREIVTGPPPPPKLSSGKKICGKRARYAK